MSEEWFGDCLKQLMKKPPSNHECNPRCLAYALGHRNTNEVNRWRRNGRPPKLDSGHVEKIAQHLGLSSAQHKELREAQIRGLSRPRPKKQPSEDPPPPVDDTPPPYAGATGKAVVEKLIALLEEAPDGTGRDEPNNTITLTWRSRTPLQMTDEQQRRWRVAFQSLLQRGWQVRYLCLLDRNVYRTVNLVQNMLEYTSMGVYLPRYFTTGYATLPAATDLLVIPGVGGAWLYAAHAADRADAGIIVRNQQQVRAMMEHAAQLERQTLPLATPPARHGTGHATANPVIAIREAEDNSGGRLLFKYGLSLFTQPKAWFTEAAAPQASGLAMTAEQWEISRQNQLQRVAAFERYVQHDEYRDICPLSALESLIRDGVYPRDDIFFERTQGPRRCLEHLRNTVAVLQENPLYSIGFIDDRRLAPPGSAANRRLDSMWQVTGDGSVFLATWVPDAAGRLVSANLHITEHNVAQGFREYFEQLWNKIPPADHERDAVIRRLNHEIKELERRIARAKA
jgi:hypothetical protein